MAHGPDTDKLFAKIKESSKYLYAHDLNITSLPDIPDTIIGIWINNTNIKHIKSLPPKLEVLVCEYSSLETLCELPPTLEMLNVDSTKLTELPELPDKLSSLNVSCCSFTFLPKLPASLKMLICFNVSLIGLEPYCIFTQSVQIKFCNNIWADLQPRKRVCDRVAIYEEELIEKAFFRNYTEALSV